MKLDVADMSQTGWIDREDEADKGVGVGKEEGVLSVEERVQLMKSVIVSAKALNSSNGVVRNLHCAASRK